MQRRIAVRGIIFLDNKLLCCKLTDYSSGTAPDYWCVPGGRLELGESVVDGLKRELVEELGVAPEIGALLYVQQFRENKDELVDFFFNIENAKDYLKIDLSKTSHGLVELRKIKFIDPKLHKVLPEFLSQEPIDTTQVHTKFYSYL